MTETGQSHAAAGMSRGLWPVPPHSAPCRPLRDLKLHTEVAQWKQRMQNRAHRESISGTQLPVAASGWVWGCGPSLYTSVIITFPSLLQ